MLCCIAGKGRCTLELLWRYKDNDTLMSGTRAIKCTCLPCAASSHEIDLYGPVHVSMETIIFYNLLAKILLSQPLF
jgi:hypothetical protein